MGRNNKKYYQDHKEAIKAKRRARYHRVKYGLFAVFSNGEEALVHIACRKHRSILEDKAKRLWRIASHSIKTVETGRCQRCDFEKIVEHNANQEAIHKSLVASGRIAR